MVISAAGITACTDCFVKMIEEEPDLRAAQLMSAYMQALERRVNQELRGLEGGMGDNLYSRLAGRGSGKGRPSSRITNKY